jgi:hypothetical protein
MAGVLSVFVVCIEQFRRPGAVDTVIGFLEDIDQLSIVLLSIFGLVVCVVGCAG